MPTGHRRKRSSELFVSSPDPEPLASPSARRSPSGNTGSANKRQRTSDAFVPINEDDGLFLDNNGEFDDDCDNLFGEADLEEGVIDLRPSQGETAAEKAAREEAEQKERRKNWVRLATFQCAICMDHATKLTVTHCGHMFCLECLSNALRSEYETNKCPICRQKVESKDRGSYTSKTKGFWPLEIKVKTRPRKPSTAPS
ncbi:Helicase-like transcription factor [Ceratocystis fimbriata CBS 114723]|uniref:Helicase-like transcription factor n=1 Tax=Ceratocystis fimbriata CBS 114723 TaxID=1035309 RepID=A0A2C5WWF4_9PEZI|nr:Helicase-like transcription factor [Ceratocystis fimbriata CBS 114723]